MVVSLMQMDILVFIFSLSLSYQFNKSLSKTGGKINKKLPLIKARFIQFSPNFKITIRNKSIWIHHWLTYTIILAITLTTNAGILSDLFSRGYLIGGILQGLSYPDWKKFIVRKQ
jgi:hypothetical protein